MFIGHFIVINTYLFVFCRESKKNNRILFFLLHRVSFEISIVLLARIVFLSDYLFKLKKKTLTYSP